MVRYFYAWTPLVIVAAVVILSMPWLGLVAVMILAIVALLALAALASAVVFVPYMLGREIVRRWHTRTGASPPTTLSLRSANRQTDSVWQGASSHPVSLSVSRELQAPQKTFSDGHMS